MAGGLGDIFILLDVVKPSETRMVVSGMGRDGGIEETRRNPYTDRIAEGIQRMHHR
jgi:hypothetical protein